MKNVSHSTVIIIIIINVIYMAQIRRMQQMRHVDCYRRYSLDYVMRNVFSRAQKTDSDMSCNMGFYYHNGPQTQSKIDWLIDWLINGPHRAYQSNKYAVM